MKFGIIAAGEGSRLRDEGVLVPKPLIVLDDETMLGRLFRIFTQNGASEIVVIVNELHEATYESALACQARHQREGLCPIRIVHKTTPGSMYSFKELSRFFKEEPFCLTTIDTIFNETEFSAYLHRFTTSEADALMAVTDYVEDEKPLYVKVSGLKIEDFMDEGPAPYISGGIYCMRPIILTVLEECMQSGKTRMRDFQRALVRGGLKVEAFPFSKILDVDHASDIEQAKDFLAKQSKVNPDVLCVYRDLAFSPQSEAKDEAIMNKVVDLLRMEGCRVRCKKERDLSEEDKCSRVVSMARMREKNALIQQWEKQGCQVWNSPSAILNLNRTALRVACETLGFKVPALASENNYPQWIKRADTISAMREGDVCFVQSENERISALKKMQSHGIEMVECTEHITGDLLKFYGVYNENSNHLFFSYTYPKESEHPSGRFGLACYNEAIHHYQFDEAILREQAMALARILNVVVFGGDVIVKEDGSFVWIDFNDFPSFSSCREEAAVAIKRLIQC